MSDEATNNPQTPEAKPKKQPKQWPGRSASASAAPAPAADAPPASAPETAAPAEAGAAETASGEKPKKLPKIWKGKSGAAAPAAAPAPAAAGATPRAAVAPAAPTQQKIAASARPSAPVMQIPRKPEVLESEARLMRRRRFAITCVFGFLVANFMMFLRFFFPRVLFEPRTVFKIGYPSDFGFGVDTKYQKDYRIWVVRNAEGLFTIYARCTHLGCTPDWIASENKFKCPCHGSGYDSEGINFEGPAPRPMDRAKVELDPEGMIVVDTSKLYQWPKGEDSQFRDPGAFVSV